MSKDIFGGVGNIAQKISHMYGGDPNSKAAKIKKVYIGDSNNKAHLYWWNVIMFTIDGTPYECAPNTTWGEWASAYIVDGGISFDGGTTFVCDADKNRVSTITVITEGNYITYREPEIEEPEIEYLTFTVDGKPQTVEAGTKWFEWANGQPNYAVIGDGEAISKDGGGSRVSKYDGTSVVPSSAIEIGTYVSMVFFTVDDIPHFVTDGMKWSAWAIGGDYAVDGDKGITQDAGASYLCDEAGNRVVATNAITKGRYTNVKVIVYVKFTVDGIQRAVVEGTTWSEWAATSNGLYYVDGDTIREKNTQHYVSYSDKTKVSASEDIVAGNYILWDGIVYIEFYIGDEEHNCPKGMNWADAITLGYLDGYRVKGLSLYDGYVINASDLRVVNSSNTPVHSSNPITEGYHYGIEIRNEINFTVDGKPQTVEAGTYWYDWAKTTEGYEVIEPNGIPLISKDGGISRLVDKDGYDVVATEVITGLAGPYVSRYYEEPEPELPIIKFTLDGVEYSVEGVQIWGTWVSTTNGLYTVVEGDETITKENGVSRVLDENGNEVKATDIIGGGTYTSVNYEIEEPEIPTIKFTVDGKEYSYEGVQTWLLWLSENPEYQVDDNENISKDGGYSRLVDSEGNEVKPTDIIGGGTYTSEGYEFTVTIDGTQYTFIGKILWGTWANANADYEVVDGSEVISKEAGYSRLVDEYGNDVKAADVIKSGAYTSEYYVIEFIVDGTPYEVRIDTLWGTWANSTNGLYYVSDYNEHITKEDGVSRLVYVHNGAQHEVTANKPIHSGTFTSVNYEIEEPELTVYKFTVDGKDFEVEGEQYWSTWADENGYDVYESSGEPWITMDGGISYVCDSDGNPVTGFISGGDYSSTIVFTCDNVTRYFVVSYVDEEENVILDRTWGNYISTYNPSYEGMAEFYVQDNGIVIGGYGSGPVRTSGGTPVYDTDEICWGDTYETYS